MKLVLAKAEEAKGGNKSAYASDLLKKLDKIASDCANFPIRLKGSDKESHEALMEGLTMARDALAELK